MPRIRTLLLTAFTLLAAAAPAGAATQQFAGTLEDGRRLVTFTAQSPGALTAPRVLRGLAAGERLLALGARDGTLYGLGSTARVYVVDVRRARVAPATPDGRSALAGLRGTRFSLAVAPDRSFVRILSDVGQDVTLELRTGTVQDGPGLRLEDGTPIRPAVDLAADGRLVGVDLGRELVVRETAPGSGVMAAQALQGMRSLDPGRIGEPIAFALGADGRGRLTATLVDRARTRQSVTVEIDPASGRASPRLAFFLRRVDAFAPLRLVAEDDAAPRARIRVPGTLSVRELLATRRLRVSVGMPEAGQVLTSLRTSRRAGSRPVGFSLATVDLPSTIRTQQLFVNRRDRRILRRAIGTRIAVVVTTNDFAGNGRSVVRWTRLVR